MSILIRCRSESRMLSEVIKWTMYIETLKNVNLHVHTENRCNSCKKGTLAVIVGVLLISSSFCSYLVENHSHMIIQHHWLAWRHRSNSFRGLFALHPRFFSSLSLQRRSWFLHSLMVISGYIVSGGLVSMAFSTYSTIAFDGLETVGESRRAMADFFSPDCKRFMLLWKSAISCQALSACILLRRRTHSRQSYIWFDRHIVGATPLRRIASSGRAATARRYRLRFSLYWLCSGRYWPLLVLLFVFYCHIPYLRSNPRFIFPFAKLGRQLNWPSGSLKPAPPIYSKIFIKNLGQASNFWPCRWPLKFLINFCSVSNSFPIHAM